MDTEPSFKEFLISVMMGDHCTNHDRAVFLRLGIQRYVIGWLSYNEIYMAPQVILTWKMLSDTLNSITGHTDLLLSGESSMAKI